MKIYSVHVSPTATDGDAELVKEGFCWPAFLFTVLWAAWHRAWWVAAALLVVGIAIVLGMEVLGLGALGKAAVNLGFLALAGFHGGDFLRWSLGRRGYRDQGVVVGDDADAALHRYLDRTRGAIRQSPMAPSPPPSPPASPPASLPPVPSPLSIPEPGP